MTAPASFDLADRMALVTGGNRGIGRGIALGQDRRNGGDWTGLASSASDFVTGETTRVDGGYAIR